MKRPVQMTLAELQRYRWRTVRDMTNGFMRVPKGTSVTIYHKRNGVNIQGEKCACCGVQVRIHQVPLNDLELVSCPNCGSVECTGQCRQAKGVTCK